MIEAWGKFCAMEGLSFEAFCAGCDLLLEDREIWCDRGFAALRDKACGFH